MSLRSTPGYKLSSLRDGENRQLLRGEAHILPRAQTLFGYAPVGETLFRVEGVSAGGRARCSGPKTPPPWETEFPSTRTFPNRVWERGKMGTSLKSANRVLAVVVTAAERVDCPHPPSTSDADDRRRAAAAFVPDATHNLSRISWPHRCEPERSLSLAFGWPTQSFRRVRTQPPMCPHTKDRLEQRRYSPEKCGLP